MNTVLKFLMWCAIDEQIEAGIAEFYSSAFQFISPITQQSLWQQFFEQCSTAVPSKTFASKDFLLLQQRKFKEALALNHPASIFRLGEQHESESHLYQNPFQGLNIQQDILRLNGSDRPYLQVEPPSWLYADALYQQILAMPTLYQHGRVVWGCLVHTHDIMHYPGDEHCDGEIIYDPTGRTNPAQLQVLAYNLHRLRGTQSKKPDVSRYIEHLNTEHSRIFAFPYPHSMSELAIRVSSIWFYRDHLPNGMLALPYFPILLCDDDKHRGHVMVLPARFWPKDFRDSWHHLANKNLTQHHDLSETLSNMPKHVAASAFSAVPSLALIYDNLDFNRNKQQFLQRFFKPLYANTFSMAHLMMIMLTLVIFTLVALML